MRRGRIFIFLAIILLVGLVIAAVALPRVLPMLRPTPTAKAYQVYYALQNISQGTIVTEDLLGTYNLPETSFADVMFTTEEKSSLVGQKAKIAIDQGVPFTTGMITSPDAGLEAGGPPWASIIAATKNAITIPTSRLASVGFGVADGAHVNVIACMLIVDVDPSYQAVLPNHVAVAAAPANVKPDEMPGISLGVDYNEPDPPYQGRTEVEAAFQQPIYIVPSEPQRPRPVCQMVMQDVTVLRLGNFELNPTTQAANQATPTPQPNQQQAATNQLPPDIVTLIVSPQEAVLLTYMIYTNTPLYLTLRNSGDPSRQVTESATLQFLLSQLDIDVPVKLAYSMTPRVDTLALPFLTNDVVTVSP